MQHILVGEHEINSFAVMVECYTEAHSDNERTGD